MGRTYSTNGEKNIYRILVRKSEGRRPLGRQRRRWMDNVKMDRMGLNGLIDLIQDRDQWLALVNTVITFQIP
jgi:transposase